MALLSLSLRLARKRPAARWPAPPPDTRPFGEPRSSEEPYAVELRRAHEDGRGRHAAHPLQIPWRGWKDILWRTYAEMQSDRLLSIAGGVGFFVLLAIFPAITALVSAYGLFFNASTITNNLSLLDDIVPANVLTIVHEQAQRIAANSGGALSLGIIVGILVSLWSAMSGVKAMIDALNVIYEQQESRNFFKLSLVALVFTLCGFATFLLAIAAVIVLPLVLAPIGLGSAAGNADARLAVGRSSCWFCCSGLPYFTATDPTGGRRAGNGSVSAVCLPQSPGSSSRICSPGISSSFANYNATYGSLGAVVG